jgi:transcriptional regulator with XRE-family HTH domain
MDLSPLEIWERLSEIAKKQGKPLQQAYMAADLGRGTISGWKRSFPRVDRIAAIAEFYGVSLDYLVFRKEPTILGLSHEALEISKAAEMLNAEGKRAALGMVEGLQKVYPCEILKSTGTAS